MNRIKLIVICIGLIGLFLPISVEAASDTGGFVDELFRDDVEKDEPMEENSEVESNNSEDKSILGDKGPTNPIILFIQIILTLAFIIGLIYVLLKFMNKKNKLFKHAATLENIGGIPLGTNKSIQIIRIGERFFVVGVGENVELLSEITDEKTLETLMKDQSTEQANSNQISDVFTQVFPSLLTRKKQSDKRKKVTAQYKRKEEDKNE